MAAELATQTKESEMNGVITPTTKEQRTALALAGYVHVTGLTARCGNGPDQKVVIGAETLARHVGKWDLNNGMRVIVTTGAEIWLACGSSSIDSELVKTLCPHGRGTFVPCSNGEEISMTDLLQRFDNADWNPNSY